MAESARGYSANRYRRYCHAALESERSMRNLLCVIGRHSSAPEPLQMPSGYCGCQGRGYEDAPALYGRRPYVPLGVKGNGWLGLLSPASSVIASISNIGFIAFFVFMLSMGIALLRAAHNPTKQPKHQHKHRADQRPHRSSSRLLDTWRWMSRSSTIPGPLPADSGG
jgi:hypothetical protein